MRLVLPESLGPTTLMMRVAPVRKTFDDWASVRAFAPGSVRLGMAISLAAPSAEGADSAALP